MTLSILTQGECDLILPWRNAPAVRQAMFTHHEISLTEHRAWFHSMQNDPTARWYIYRDWVNEPRGVVYFTSFDVKNATAFWGFYTSTKAVPGTGIRMEFEALSKAFDELGLYKLNCEVLADNKAVINMHKKVGFTQEGLFREQHFNGNRRIDVIRLGMLSREWLIERKRLLKRIQEKDKAQQKDG